MLNSNPIFVYLIISANLLLSHFKHYLIFPQLTETGVIFLNASEHLFHIRLGKMHQNRTSVGTVIGIVTLRKLIEELSSRMVIDTMVGLDRPLAGHHNSQLCSIFLDRNFLGQKEHVTHFIDA